MRVILTCLSQRPQIGRHCETQVAEAIRNASISVTKDATELSLGTKYIFGKLTIAPRINYALNYEKEINQGKEEIWTLIETSWKF